MVMCAAVVLTSKRVPPQLHFEVPLSPVIAPKKARPADTGSDEVSVLNRGTKLKKSFK